MDLFNPPTHRNPSSDRILKSIQKYGRSLNNILFSAYPGLYLEFTYLNTFKGFLILPQNVRIPPLSDWQQYFFDLREEKSPDKVSSPAT